MCVVCIGLSIKIEYKGPLYLVPLPRKFKLCPKNLYLKMM